MRALTRDAVSFFVFQIGRTIPRMSAVSTSATGLFQIGAA
jgi:hypothetical protein